MDTGVEHRELTSAEYKKVFVRVRLRKRNQDTPSGNNFGRYRGKSRDLILVIAPHPPPGLVGILSRPSTALSAGFGLFAASGSVWCTQRQWRVGHVKSESDDRQSGAWMSRHPDLAPLLCISLTGS